MKKTIYHEIENGNGIMKLKDMHKFDTAEEAIELVKKFKANPKMNNPKMSDDSEKYWKNQTFTIVKKTIIREEIISI